MSILALLDGDKLPEDVYIGHLLEMSGAIPHDEELAESYSNNMARTHLRIAEAFAAGLKAGRRP